MKNSINKIFFPFFALGLFSHASDIATSNCPKGCPSGKADLNKFQEKNWYLDEVRIGTNIITINRDNKPELSYTIMFNGERFAGFGAPNQYFGIYTAYKDNTVLFKKIGNTRMRPIFEMDGIKEYEYFSYIDRAAYWKIREGKLELHSSKEDGTKVILVYTDGNNK